MARPTKFSGPKVSYGLLLLRDELHALRDLGMHEQRPISDLLRGSALLLLERTGRYEPEPGTPDEAVLRIVKNIISRNGQEEN